MTAHGGALSGVSPPPTKTAGSFTLVLLLCLIPPAILAAGWLFKPVWAWVAIMVLLAAFTVLVGHQLVNKLWRGAFVDPRNKISLSRFQTILWTFLVIAGFLATALYNIRIGASDPLSIAVPQQVWALLGISVSALVGSSLIKSQQSIKSLPNNTESSKEADQPVQKGNDGTSTTKDERVVGVLTTNAHPEQSSWSDMFEAEQVGSEGHLDLTKIQMFYFTIILVFAYAVAIATMLSHASGKIGEFPALDNSMVALLGISSTAYLTGKSIPKAGYSKSNTKG